MILAAFLLPPGALVRAAQRPAKLSPEFHQNRLEELYQRCPDGLTVLRGEVDWYRKREMRALDSAYRDQDFRQERNLYYLTGIEVPDSFVLIDPRRREVRLYTDWKGKRELDEVRKLAYVTGPFPAKALLTDIWARSADYSTLYTLYVPFLRDGTLYGYSGALTGAFPPGLGQPLTEDAQFARKLAQTFPGLRLKSVYPVLLEMQQVKQPEEIRLLRQADEIGARGVVEAIKAVRPGLYDHDIGAVLEYSFLRNGAANPTFAMNVMSGPNLFLNLLPLWSDYDHLDRQMRAGEGVFLNVGAEVNYYVSDVGRTVPVSGKFSPEQRRLYDLYLPCFLKAERSVRPGITQRDLVNVEVACAKGELPGLQDAELRKATEEFIAETRSHTSLGHYQDLNVLGSGPSDDQPLKPGMVFDIEPILYSPELHFGVFMEDVILVTTDGYEVLSRGMPYTPDEIEKLMMQRSLIDADTGRR